MNFFNKKKKNSKDSKNSKGPTRSSHQKKGQKKPKSKKKGQTENTTTMEEASNVTVEDHKEQSSVNTKSTQRQRKSKSKKSQKRTGSRERKRNVTQDEALDALVNKTTNKKTMTVEEDQTQIGTCQQPSRETMSPMQAPSKETPTEVKSIVNTTSTTSIVEKWAGEPTARAWMDKCGFPKTKWEFEQLLKIPINVENCKKWRAHMKLNQSEDHPALDTNLFKCSDEKDYVNASLVDASLPRNVYISQMPVKGSEEAFWKAFFDMRITHLTILSEGLVDFFPKRNTEFVHYGSMFVNNRRAEPINEDVVRYAIEVLPAGYSNSIISTITVIKNWQPDTVHAKYAVVVKEVLELSNYFSNSPPDENAMIMSKNGVGRSGYFVALAATIHKMDQKIEPDVLELVKSIRAQRPRCVDSLHQYASIYLAMFYYIKRKASKSSEMKPPVSPDPSESLAKKAVQLSQMFTNCLTAEVEAAAAKSMMVLTLH